MKDLIRQILYEETKWNPDSLKDEALKYVTRTDFAKNSKSAYNAEKNLGIFDDVTEHMPKPKQWTQNELEIEASKYQTLSDFQDKSRGAYLKAFRLGILKDITKHMTGPINYISKQKYNTIFFMFLQQYNNIEIFDSDHIELVDIIFNLASDDGDRYDDNYDNNNNETKKKVSVTKLASLLSVLCDSDYLLNFHSLFDI
jgi:hypothetical protein